MVTRIIKANLLLAHTMGGDDSIPVGLNSNISWGSGADHIPRYPDTGWILIHIYFLIWVYGSQLRGLYSYRAVCAWNYSTRIEYIFEFLIFSNSLLSFNCRLP